MGGSVLKVESFVKRLDLRYEVDFFSKLYIHEGNLHLWFSLSDHTAYYVPEFDRQKYSRWEHVATFPLETMFAERAIPEIISHWLVWKRPYNWLMEPKEIEEICTEYVLADAMDDNRRFNQRKVQEEHARRDKFDKALVEGVLT